MRSVSLDGLDEIRDEVVATLELHADLRPGGVDPVAQAENVLSGALRQLFALSESYPDLKANQNFLQLQATLSDTEDRIQASRQIYNANVQQFNRRVQSFPSNVIANMFHFQNAEFFQIDAAQRAVVGEPPKVDFSAITNATYGQTPGAAPAPSAAPGTPPGPPVSGA